MTTPMTPDRWRAVDAVLQGALACEPEVRDAFVRDACGGDEALRREVVSLLAAHDGATDDFLERSPMESLGTLPPPSLVAALAERYTIEREIARGGMATVYVARDVRHGRRVAIKVLRADVAASIGAERFLEEIRVTASLQHPHILPLFDSGSAGNLLWYVMPFVDGETLRSRLAREGRLPIAESVRLAREIAEALAHAHARGIVHRDIKPENILLTKLAPANAGGHALVADFGIALALEQAGGERLTRTGLTLGTPQYMAPEQAAGARALDARVDVYALGAVLHEMIAGEPPFAAASRQAVVQRMMHEPPTALAARRPGVPPSLDAAVRCALAKQPDDRFPSAVAFAAALASSEESVDAAPLTSAASSRRVVARVAIYAAFVGIVVGLVGAWAIGRSPLVKRVASTLPEIHATPNVGSVSDGRDAGDGLALVVVDRAGQLQREIAAVRPWTPRFSPDGRRVAYGAFDANQNASDVWVTELATGTTRQLTSDHADENDPQWSADGATIAYSVSAAGGKDLATMRVAGGTGRVLATRDGTQFPSDWLRDGSALLVTEDAGDNRRDILVQPADGSPARPYVATKADETAARISPDGHWVAYTSDESGRGEVYLDSYPHAGRRVLISQSGGYHPVWRRDGRELYYWRDDALVAAHVGAAHGSAPPTVDAGTVLFRTPYAGGLNTMYDVSPDGQRFVIVRHR